MLNIFIGIDTRQPVAYHVLVSSIQRRASQPVAFTPLLIDQLPISRRGLTDFTFARFLVPYLCGYQGKGVFLDSDMLVTADISELFEYSDDEAVSVVPFQGELQYERPSVMVFNNERCKDLTPEYIDDLTNEPFDLSWADKVGELSSTWNFLVGYDMPSHNTPKLIHYTQGVPGYKECRNCDYAELWHQELALVQHHVSWLEIMGQSKHAKYVLRNLSYA